MSKIEQIESELQKLSQSELREIHNWLDDFLENEREFTPEFEAAIKRSEQDMVRGERLRVRKPESR